MKALGPEVWHIGDVIRKLRDRHDPPLTIEKLAELADVSKNTIGAWEAGEVTDPNPKTLRQVATVLRVRPEFISAQVPVPPPTGETPPSPPLDDQERSLIDHYRRLPEHLRTNLVEVVRSMNPPDAHGRARSDDRGGGNDPSTTTSETRRATR